MQHPGHEQVCRVVEVFSSLVAVSKQHPVDNAHLDISDRLNIWAILSHQSINSGCTEAPSKNRFGTTHRCRYGVSCCDPRFKNLNHSGFAKLTNLGNLYKVLLFEHTVLALDKKYLRTRIQGLNCRWSVPIWEPIQILDSSFRTLFAWGKYECSAAIVEDWV